MSLPSMAWSDKGDDDDDGDLFFAAQAWEPEPLDKAEEDPIFFDIINDNEMYNNNKNDDAFEILEPAPTRARHSYDTFEVAPLQSSAFTLQDPSVMATTVTAEGDGDSTIATAEDDFSNNNNNNNDTESLKSENTRGSNSSSESSSSADELAKELYELSMRERQLMLHDVHGVPDEIDDSPETENKALQELNDWIVQHYDTEEAAAYRRAESISKSFVESRDLRLQFLRGVTDYDIERAGPRFFNHFALKLDLFGESKLCKERLTLGDLDEDDMECLRVGFIQVLPFRDSGDRTIIFLNFSALKYKALTNALRCMYYVTMALYEDVNVQKKGVVVVTMGLQFGSNMKYFGYQFLYNFGRVALGSPIRAAGIHHCLQPGITGTLVSWFSTLLPPRARIRTRIHVGSHDENIFKLMSHGIPARFLPIVNNDTTVPDTKWHSEWIEIRRKVEARHQDYETKKKADVAKDVVTLGTTTTTTTSSTSTPAEAPPSNNDNVVIVPSPKDILMGRGKRTMTSPGNIRLYMTLDDNFDRYESVARHLKSTIAQEMVDLVKAQGCRFLEQVDGFWCQVDDVKARNKVSHDFRTLRSSKKRQEDPSSAATKKPRGNNSKANKRSRQQSCSAMAA